MKTVSLELSKELRKAGYPQNISLHRWTQMKGAKEAFFHSIPGFEADDFTTIVDDVTPLEGQWDSPTADEILEKLPAEIQDGELYGLEIQKTPNFYISQYYDNYGRHSLVSRSAKELSDLFAIMWLYLKENNLLT